MQSRIDQEAGIGLIELLVAMTVMRHRDLRARSGLQLGATSRSGARRQRIECRLRSPTRRWRPIARLKTPPCLLFDLPRGDLHSHGFVSDGGGDGRTLSHGGLRSAMPCPVRHSRRIRLPSAPTCTSPTAESDESS